MPGLSGYNRANRQAGLLAVRRSTAGGKDMATQTCTLRVPALGKDPTFDDFVDAQLSRHSDCIDQEKSLVWEGMTEGCDGEWNPADDFRTWWDERYEQLRAGFWEEWTGAASVEPWEALNEAQQDNEALRQQGAEKEGTINRLRKRVRKLKREKATTEEALWHTKAELQIEREVTDHMREENRCKECKERMFSN